MQGVDHQRYYAGLLAVCALCTSVAGAAEPATAAGQAVRNAADLYAKAYNAGDAGQLAALFTDDARITDETGRVIQGRDEIRKIFETLFKADPGVRIEIRPGSVSQIDPHVILEEGITLRTRPGSGEVERSNYSALHVQQGNAWLIRLARDWPAAPQSPLQQLGWLIGDWVDEGTSSVVKTTYKWSPDERFLLGEANVYHQGKPVLSISQRIGWDGAEGTLRVWVFDSRGGFSEGTWTPAGEGWTAVLQGVNGSGERTTAVNSIRRVSADRFTWESRNRTVGGRTLPDLEPFPSVRQAVSPAARQTAK